jgi:hypothetical protein
MAFAHGRTCELAADGLDITELFRSAAFQADADTSESTTFRKYDKTFEVGQRQSAISLDGLYDEARQAEVEARLIAAPFIATVGPAGLAVGARARLMEVNTTNVTETSGIGDVVMLTWALQSTGVTGYGYALSKPDTAVTGDTNGAAVDTGAAVSGALWVAHFHLHAISATNVVLTVQDSADGVSGWANIASVTSGALTAIGGVRVTGTGTTKRYIRVASDFTGGASTGRYTVGFSRIAP